MAGDVDIGRRDEPCTALDEGHVLEVLQHLSVLVLPHPIHQGELVADDRREVESRDVQLDAWHAVMVRQVQHLTGPEQGF